MPSVSVVLIHGVGAQKKDWSQAFQGKLKTKLGAAAAKVAIHDSYWGDRSDLKDLVHPSLLEPEAAPLAAVEDETFNRIYREYSAMLAADAQEGAGIQGFGIGDAISFVKEKLKGVADGAVADVANYVARNGVRVGVQNRLHEALKAAGAMSKATRTVLVAHSQGTIISYDVLRAAGSNYEGLTTWITMGCPLAKYVTFPLSWGKQQFDVSTGLRWLNLYDAHDFVGKKLAGVLDWQDPKPEDRQVDNVANAGHAHNHWANPQVVDTIAAEVQKQLSNG